MNRFLLQTVSVLTAVAALTFTATASAETVSGRVKAIAEESKLFSISTDPENGILIFWNDKTVWKGIGSYSGLKLDEILSVDIKPVGDSFVASAVSRLKTPVPAGMKLITLDRLTERLASNEITVVDARAAALYDAGHIPGAISIPLAKLEKRTIGLLPENRSAKIVFYDEGQGGTSAGKAAELSGKSGYTDIELFREGAAGWSDSGRFLASSTTFIRKANPAIIDVRPQELVVKGHIEKAVNWPASALKDYSGKFPMGKLAPIVLYGDSDKDAVTAAETVRSWGYRRVTIYPGGAAAWADNAEVLEKGPAAEEISSVAAAHGGKLQAKDFEMALMSPVMVEIVDVRSAGDHKKGGFPKSRKISLADLGKKHNELDRDKIQVIFAADSARAEMAYDFLKSKGYRANYLSGSVEFAKDGKYKLKEE